MKTEREIQQELERVTALVKEELDMDIKLTVVHSGKGFLYKNIKVIYPSKSNAKLSKLLEREGFTCSKYRVPALEGDKSTWSKEQFYAFETMAFKSMPIK